MIQVHMDRDLREVVDALVGAYKAERIILFGSAASGDPAERGDFDLVVIKRTQLPFFDRLKEVAEICRWHKAFDVLVYTPEELAAMSAQNGFVRDEVLAKGRVLYDRAA